MLAVFSSVNHFSLAFVPSSYSLFATKTSSSSCTYSTQQQFFLFMSTTTVIPGTEEKQDQDEQTIIIPPGEGDIRGPIEWLIDDTDITREINDPFHILLLDETFVQNSRISIEYVASSCAYVLSMPYDEAAELASHAEKEGFSCLGTWGHEECLRLGKQLQQRDLVVRVVPFCEGGDRAWQARKADEEMKSANDNGSDSGWN